jgi:hypothetical protein
MSRLTNALFGIDPRISALWRTEDFTGLVALAPSGQDAV